MFETIVWATDGSELANRALVPVMELARTHHSRIVAVHANEVLKGRFGAAPVLADEFDIARKPNPHLGFGQGVHYCLGANLARLELRVLYEELFSRFQSVRVVRPVEWTRSNRHTGIRHLVVELR